MSATVLAGGGFLLKNALDLTAVSAILIAALVVLALGVSAGAGMLGGMRARTRDHGAQLERLGSELDELRAIVMPSWIYVAIKRAEELGWEVNTGTQGMAFVPPRGEGRSYVVPLPLTELPMQHLHRGELFDRLDLNGTAIIRYLA